MVRSTSTNSQNQSAHFGERTYVIVRIAFAGTPEAAIPTLAELLKANVDIAFVVTRPDAPKGRGRVMTASPVAEFAQQHDLPVVKTSKLTEIADQFTDIDCVVVVAFGALVPDVLLNVPKHGWINVHFSLLPAWRGAAPVQHAIMAGDDMTGVTTFRIDSGLDTGDVLGHVATPIRQNETSGELLERLSHEGATLLVQTVMGLESGQIVPIAQPSHGVSLAPKITVADARINWTHPALAIQRRVRAMTPDPGSWTMCAGKRIKISDVTLNPALTDLPPAHAQLHDGSVCVGTGSHAVQVGTIHEEGRTPTPAHVWLKNRAGEAVFE